MAAHATASSPPAVALLGGSPSSSPPPSHGPSSGAESARPPCRITMDSNVVAPSFASRVSHLPFCICTPISCPPATAGFYASRLLIVAGHRLHPHLKRLT
ncbi:uncharacterized protein [Miscanthus floridulus]|uniref:uncharacterized protein isoform X2 n=1 Tax=Miscanthus floridulus TaxID=154761 RepID=UPI003458A727